LLRRAHLAAALPSPSSSSRQAWHRVVGSAVLIYVCVHVHTCHGGALFTTQHSRVAKENRLEGAEAWTVQESSGEWSDASAYETVGVGSRSRE